MAYAVATGLTVIIQDKWKLSQGLNGPWKVISGRAQVASGNRFEQGSMEGWLNRQRAAAF